MNIWTIRSKETEPGFIRRVKTGTTFYTGTGRENVIVAVDGDGIYIRTAKSKNSFAIPRSRLSRAIEHMLQVRTTTRRELEKQCKYRSSLMALLRLLFIGKARVHRTLRGPLSLTLRDVRHVFSGVTRAPRDMQMVQGYGGVEVLISYAHARDDKYSRWAESIRRIDGTLGVMLDSEAYSVFAAQRRGHHIRPITVQEYAAFIKQHEDVVDSIINLDVVGDPEASERNANYLRSQGIDVIPVWHCQRLWNVLEAIVRRDEPIIAVGGSAFLSTSKRREIFDELFRRYFSGVAFHLFGGTSPNIAEYPWFSADSTTYLIGRKYRKLVTPTLQMDAPADWTTEECLAFNIRELSRIEGNYSRNYGFPLVIKPEIKPSNQERQQTLLFA